MMTTGPFRMAPGDSQQIVVAYMIEQGRDRLSSISGVRFNDIYAQDAFYRNFLLPSPPPQPKVNVAVDNGKVQLCWDSASRFNYPRPAPTSPPATSTARPTCSRIRTAPRRMPGWCSRW